MQHATQLVITSADSVQCLYADAIDLSVIDLLPIEHVSLDMSSPHGLGQWQADLAPAGTIHSAQLWLLNRLGSTPTGCRWQTNGKPAFFGLLPSFLGFPWECCAVPAPFA